MNSMTSRSRPWAVRYAVPLLLATLLALAACGLHLYLRFVNNTQNEMYLISGGIDYVYAAELFAFTFAVVWPIVFVPTGALTWIIYRVIDRLRD